MKKNPKRWLNRGAFVGVMIALYFLIGQIWHHTDKAVCGDKTMSTVDTCAGYTNGMRTDTSSYQTQLGADHFGHHVYVLGVAFFITMVLTFVAVLGRDAYRKRQRNSKPTA